jgi:hypothetical protein
MNTQTNSLEPGNRQWAVAIAKRLLDEPMAGVFSELDTQEQKVVSGVYTSCFGRACPVQLTNLPEVSQTDREILISHLETHPEVMQELIGTYVIEENYFEESA